MAPAYERLHSDEGSRGQVGGGLEQKEELAILKSTMQIHLEMPVIIHGLLHRVREENGAVLTGGLRLVQGDIGISQELVGCRPIALGNTDAGGHHQWNITVGDLEGCAQYLEDSLRHDVGPGLERSTLDQHDELVPPQTPDRISFA